MPLSLCPNHSQTQNPQNLARCIRHAARHTSHTSMLLNITLSAMLSHNHVMGDAFMDWLVYIVECRDGSLYTGITNDLQKRIESHNAGTGAKYTAARRPVRLVYREDAASRSAASKREIVIKRLTRKAKQALCFTQ